MIKFLRLQPSFTIDTSMPAKSVIERMRLAFKSPELQGMAVAASMCVDYKIEQQHRRFWSPHLSVQVSDTEAGSRLHCRFAPRPEIWTMFMAIYFVVLILMFAASIYGYVQWWMGDTPWTLVAIPIGAATIAGLHVASLVGQNLSTDQMILLRDRLERTLTVAEVAT
ncbi:hypothetical protein Poly51_52670 [Rubripirellula tenax]|uniref:Uncharacterized protein n=1 Tax=Rubripirellula tenax TaxID=2528015 RepID=A0A5C6EHE6_9BACT|nr:hypothetical protein [Rubripirellula tenax]TWU47467.1 hypothetical protein Poly51_52670 [Rubripirellula tenax]